MDKKEATKFFHDWLWENPNRKSESWPDHRQVADVVQMLVDATTPPEPVVQADAEVWCQCANDTGVSNCGLNYCNSCGRRTA